MKKKYLIASAPLFLGILSLIISSMVGSSIATDGTLHEPAFFLIPLSYLFFFSSIIAFLYVGILSAHNKKKTIS